MRTTLKRGIGRTAADGNGRSILPPGALTPMTRYRFPEPARRGRLPLLGRILFWLAATIVALAVAAVGGVYLWLHESLSAIRAHSVDVRAAQKRLDAIPPPGQAAIALVVGYDRRAGDTAQTPSRSDTVMLVRADPQTKSISMLSFPRDLAVDVRCPGKPTYRGRINEAYAGCGSKGTLDTVKQLIAPLPINYLITVNFRGFKQIVNQLGGVWVDVDRRYFNDNRGRGVGFTYATINLKPGYQRLTGGSALDFVRYRHTDSDLYRVARQQLFVEAMKQQFAKAFSLDKVPGLIGAITHNVEVGVGGGKELSGKKVLSYALFAYHLPSGHFFQSRIEGLTGYSELYTDSSNLQTAIEEFANPDVDAPEVATAVALRRKLRSRAPKPAETTITVLNGNNVPGSASNAGQQLRSRGYRILTPPSNATGNAPSFDYFHAAVYFDPRQPRTAAAAREVAKLFAPADVKRVPRIIRPLSNRAMLVVVVGALWAKNPTIAPARLKRTPERLPPRVIDNGAGTEALVKEAQRKVRFRLEVPTVLEETSVADPEEPIRVYAIARKHVGVRLTFRTAQREYWGIQETEWADAPVLSGRNFRRFLGGRTFDLYYSGPHLHMVVLRAKGATYWVVNTLLDSLSNETMLAIAKGLRPLGKR